MQGSRSGREGAPHRRSGGVTRCNQRRKIDHDSHLGLLEQATRIISGQRSHFFPLRRRRSFLQSLEPEGPLWERLMAEKRT